MIICLGSVVEGIQLLHVIYLVSIGHMCVCIILLLLLYFWRYPILQFWLFSTRDELQLLLELK